MSAIEYNTILKRIEETKAAIIDNDRCTDVILRQFIADELAARLELLEKKKSAMEEQYSKETIALRIYGDAVETGKISSRTLVSVLNGFQTMLDSVANSLFHGPTTRGRIPSSIKEITDFAVTGVFAGSFGLTLVHDLKQPGLESGITDIEQSLSGLFNVLEAMDNDNLLLSAITPYGKRAVNYYKCWLEDIKSNDVNVEVKWLDDTANKREVHLKNDKAITIISQLETIERIENEDQLFIGRLNGVNIRNHSFEMSIDEIGIIKGTALPEVLLSIIDKIGTTVKAKLTKSTSFTKAGVEKDSWFLSRIEEE